MRLQDFYCGRSHNKGLFLYMILPGKEPCSRKRGKMSNIVKKELLEAIEAGEHALESLYAASEKLNSAKNWGLLDLFGGGFITDLIKHSKLNDAADYLEQARSDLRIFQRELQDVQVPMDIRLEVGNFLTFADFFFDGIVADYLVQSKINETRNELVDAIRKVQYLLSDLKKWYGWEEK